MLSFVAGLVLGLMFGGLVGVVVMALCVVAKEADQHIEQMQPQEVKNVGTNG